MARDPGAGQERAPTGVPPGPAATWPGATQLAAFAAELAARGSDLPGLLQLVAERATAVVGDGSILALLSDDGAQVEPVAVHHREADTLPLMHALAERSYPVGETIAGRVAATRRPIVLGADDLAGTDEVAASAVLAEVAARHAIHSLMVVPLVGYGELVGTLEVLRTSSTEAYGDTDLALLQALGERAALAIVESRSDVAPGAADLEAIFRNTPDGVLFTVPDGRILAANPAACALLGRSVAEIRRLGRQGLVVPDDQLDAGVRRRELVGRARSELTFTRPDGTTFVAEVTSSLFTTQDGDVRACVIFRDIGEQVALRERLARQRAELARLADEDPLSGLLNRRGFLRAAEQVLAFADRHGLTSHLLFIDVDGLKVVNDRLGHDTGDLVLRRLSSAIEGSIRQMDHGARLAGDEFAVLLPDSTEASARLVIDRIRDRFTAGAPDDVPHRFSAGLAGRPPGSPLSVHDLLAQADQRMYRDKLDQRTRFPAAARRS